MTLAEDRDYIGRHRAVWAALVEAGLMSPPPWWRLETGHPVVIGLSAVKGEWFANLLSAREKEALPHVIWLGADDEQVPERFRQALAEPELMEYLRSTMA